MAIDSTTSSPRGEVAQLFHEIRAEERGQNFVVPQWPVPNIGSQNIGLQNDSEGEVEETARRVQGLSLSSNGALLGEAIGSTSNEPFFSEQMNANPLAGEYRSRFKGAVPNSSSHVRQSSKDVKDPVEKLTEDFQKMTIQDIRLLSVDELEQRISKVIAKVKELEVKLREVSEGLLVEECPKDGLQAKLKKDVTVLEAIESKCASLTTKLSRAQDSVAPTKDQARISSIISKLQYWQIKVYLLNAQSKELLDVLRADSFLEALGRCKFGIKTLQDASSINDTRKKLHRSTEEQTTQLPEPLKQRLATLDRVWHHLALQAVKEVPSLAKLQGKLADRIKEIEQAYKKHLERTVFSAGRQSAQVSDTALQAMYKQLSGLDSLHKFRYSWRDLGSYLIGRNAKTWKCEGELENIIKALLELNSRIHKSFKILCRKGTVSDADRDDIRDLFMTLQIKHEELFTRLHAESFNELVPRVANYDLEVSELIHKTGQALELLYQFTTAENRKLFDTQSTVFTFLSKLNGAHSEAEIVGLFDTWQKLSQFSQEIKAKAQTSPIVSAVSEGGIKMMEQVIARAAVDILKFTDEEEAVWDHVISRQPLTLETNGCLPQVVRSYIQKRILKLLFLSKEEYTDPELQLFLHVLKTQEEYRSAINLSEKTYADSFGKILEAYNSRMKGKVVKAAKFDKVSDLFYFISVASVKKKRDPVAYVRAYQQSCSLLRDVKSLPKPVQQLISIARKKMSDVARNQKYVSFPASKERPSKYDHNQPLTWFATNLRSGQLAGLDLAEVKWILFRAVGCCIFETDTIELEAAHTLVALFLSEPNFKEFVEDEKGDIKELIYQNAITKLLKNRYEDIVENERELLINGPMMEYAKEGKVPLDKLRVVHAMFHLLRRENTVNQPLAMQLKRVSKEIEESYIALLNGFEVDMKKFGLDVNPQK